MDEQQYAEWLKANYYTIGATEAARMLPEDEARYLREQLQHRDRQLEELRAVFEMRMRELSDCHATIRTLVKMAGDSSLRGL